MEAYRINRDFQGPGEQFGGGSIPGIGASVLTGLAGFYDTYQRHRDVKSEQEARKKEAELAYQRSVEMWHMQNAYNTPEMQMKRFGAAGLNPHLIYGQGSSGLASAPPAYQPPEISMRGMHGQYGGAIGTMLPTLMAVGTWMQNMRLAETDIKSKETGMDKTRQLIEYLKSRNPKELQRLENQLEIFPYQRSAARNVAEKGNVALTDAMEMLRYRWGHEYSGLEFGDFHYKEAGRGAKAVELQRLIAEARLKSAQADWFEPATIMRLVLGSVLGVSRMGSRVASRSGGRAIREIGKGQRGRWSAKDKRWLPSKR